MRCIVQQVQSCIVPRNVSKGRTLEVSPLSKNGHLQIELKKYLGIIIDFTPIRMATLKSAKSGKTFVSLCSNDGKVNKLIPIVG